VVPFRNTVMLACAMAYAAGHKCDTVRYGAHAGDHTIYPDCREEYVSALNTVGLLGDWNHVRVQAPYQNLTKAGILLRGFAIDPHLDYGDTWTCYKGEAKACGTCGACQERLEAFSQIGRQDPLEYAQ
jgi:7-cyano-7-deazaguanine synthase